MILGMLVQNRLLAVTVYHSVSINICVCLGLIQLKILKKVGIEVQV